jgi:cell division protein FtsB
MSTQEQQPKMWLYWIIGGLGMLLIVNLSRGAWDLYRVRDRIQQADEEVQKLAAEKQRLETEVQYQFSEDYAEQTIRDKLNMAKPGEVVVILPALTPIATPSGWGVAVTPTDEPPIWKKWWKIILGK